MMLVHISAAKPKQNFDPIFRFKRVLLDPHWVKKRVQICIQAIKLLILKGLPTYLINPIWFEPKLTQKSAAKNHDLLWNAKVILSEAHWEN